MVTQQQVKKMVEDEFHNTKNKFTLDLFKMFEEHEEKIRQALFDVRSAVDSIKGEVAENTFMVKQLKEVKLELKEKAHNKDIDDVKSMIWKHSGAIMAAVTAIATTGWFIMNSHITKSDYKQDQIEKMFYEINTQNAVMAEQLKTLNENYEFINLD